MYELVKWEHSIYVWIFDGMGNFSLMMETKEPYHIKANYCYLPFPY